MNIMKKDNGQSGNMKEMFRPCEVTFVLMNTDIIVTSGENPFGTTDEDFDIFGYPTGGGGEQV